MAYILQSTVNELLYFTGAMFDEMNEPIFTTDISNARNFATSSEASRVKAVISNQATRIIEV